MSTATFPTGTRFRHPTQGVCTVYDSTAKAVRYSFPGAPGFPPHHAATTPEALSGLIEAGVIHLIPAPRPAAPYRPWNTRPVNESDRAYLRSETLRTSGA